MKTEMEILEKISDIIDTSEDEQIILNASHFLYNVLIQKKNEEKFEKEREKQKELAKKRSEKLKNSSINDMFNTLLTGLDEED